MGVRASLGSRAAAVPGETAACDLTVENTGEVTEDVRMALLGEPAAWGWITPPTLSLAPGERSGARITVKVPKAPHPPAGPLEIAVLVSTAAGAVDVRGTLDIAPFADVFATLHRQPSGRGGRQVLTVENRGNAPLSAVVETEGDDVSVLVEPDQLEIGPGRTVEASVTARAGRSSFRGGATTRSFAVVVRPEGAGRPGRVEGSVERAPAGWAGRVALVLLVVAIAGAGLGALLPSRDDPDQDASSATTAPAGAASDCPARDHLSPDANGLVRDGVRPRFDYTFLFVTAQGCQPVRFNPCQPLRYALNRRLATDAHVGDLLEAVRKVSDATGMEFQRVADTDEDPRLVPRPRRQADGTLTWPPVVIGWARLGTGDGLRGRGAGRGEPGVVVGGGGRPEIVSDVIVTGNLILNLDAVADIETRTPVPHGFGTGVNWGRIMLHELAHVIGLGHVESRTSIMNEALTQQTLSSSEWGAGDLVGLRQLGREGGCVTVPPVPLQGAPR
ncbi:MAG TPA: matrixin family metalloprotease [Acidimicrobiales bacterium]|nr:matrixin family metalloprotease [Acidimicrobiales bacterium]